MSELCKVCGKPLNRSQYSKDSSYKSCPSCSERNGEQHVYYPYPKYFGTTLKRSSSNRPEGPQSYCESCRFDKNIYSNAKLCSEIEK